MFAQVYNKIDQISIEEVDKIARQPNSVVVRYVEDNFIHRRIYVRSNYNNCLVMKKMKSK